MKIISGLELYKIVKINLKIVSCNPELCLSLSENSKEDYIIDGNNLLETIQSRSELKHHDKFRDIKKTLSVFIVDKSSGSKAALGTMEFYTAI